MGKRVKLFSVTNSSGSTCLEVCVAIWGWETSWQKQVPRTETQRSQCGRHSCTALRRAAVHTPHCCWETCLDGLKSSSTVSQNKAFKLYLSSIVVTAMQNYQKLVSVVKQRLETQTKEFYQVCYLSQTFLREILPQIKRTQEEAIYKDYKLAIYSWKQFLLSY